MPGVSVAIVSTHPASVDRARSDSLVKREFGQVNRVLWRGDEVDELAHLGLKGGLCGTRKSVSERDEFRFLSACLVENLEQVDVVLLLSEMLLEQVIDGSLEHE